MCLGLITYLRQLHATYHGMQRSMQDVVETTRHGYELTAAMADRIEAIDVADRVACIESQLAELQRRLVACERHMTQSDFMVV